MATLVLPVEEQRVFVASQWQLMWWRFRKHRLAVASAVVVVGFYGLVLGLPTVGPLLLKALISQDMFLAGTIVLLLGVMTVIGTLISDIVLVWIDPRIRLEDT